MRTDGKSYEPMACRRPALIICPHCHAPIWPEDIGPPILRGSVRSPFVDIPGALFCKSPSEDDYYALLGQGDLTSERERYIRMHAWWIGNDRRLDPATVDAYGRPIWGQQPDARSGALQTPLSERQRENLVALAAMLDETNAPFLLLKAEAIRELGNFEEAVALLAKSTDPSLADDAAFIQQLAETRDPSVRYMMPDG